ncbi:MAG TPA: hypothetical protein VEA99_03780, partial [Gemmatimonadaceae bacterium]|nr:hypothetical protein [Gemmatimonadaceae bacterium]
ASPAAAQRWIAPSAVARHDAVVPAPPAALTHGDTARPPRFGVRGIVIGAVAVGVLGAFYSAGHCERSVGTTEECWKQGWWVGAATGAAIGAVFEGLIWLGRRQQYDEARGA